MSHGRASLAGARVAVVSTSLDPDANALWFAAREHVGELTVFGARTADVVPAAGERALREVDGGRGLIYRHLVGLRGALREFRPDLIHVNGEAWGLTAQEVLTGAVPTVVHGAENLWHHGRGLEQALRRRLVLRAVRRMAGYASWNHDGAAHIGELAQQSGRDLPTVVVPAIVPPPPFQHVTWTTPSIDDDERLEVLLVGQAIERKGYADVIEACSRLGRPVRVTLCGQGELVPALREHARRQGVSIRVLGWLDPPDLAAAMSRAHLLIQPSRTVPDWSEQFGRSVAEAMAVGLPCLVSDSGELPVLVGHDPSALFPEGDVRAMTERMGLLAGPPSRLGELHLSQRPLAARYEPHQASESLVTFWAGLLG